jgi:hypothetical protein
MSTEVIACRLANFEFIDPAPDKKLKEFRMPALSRVVRPSHVELR